MKSSQVWRTLTTLGHELKAQDGMNNSRLWLTYKTLGRELKALNTVKARSGG